MYLVLAILKMAFFIALEVVLVLSVVISLKREDLV